MIRILTDSACDILPAEAQQLSVTVIPPERDAGGRHRPAGRHRHDPPANTIPIWQPAASCPLPASPARLSSSSCIWTLLPPGTRCWASSCPMPCPAPVSAQGFAADLANVDNVVFVNTENVCRGQSLLVRLAVQLRDAGKTIHQIAADLEKAKQHLHLVAAVDDLKYLRKGGRLSAAAAVAGGMLGIKAHPRRHRGKVALAGKARGLPGVYGAVQEDRRDGRHPPGLPPLLGYTVNHRELQPLLTYLQDNLHLDAPLVRARSVRHRHPHRPRRIRHRVL